MEKKKDIKILLVEDDPIQIDWAREQLKEYDLTVATTLREKDEIFYDPENKNKFDIVITDLELPEDKGKEPKLFDIDANSGYSFFKSLLERRVNQISPKGLALVSNYEHHVVKSKESYQFKKAINELMLLSTLTALVQSRSRRYMNVSDNDNLVQIVKQENCANNVVIVVDNVFVNDYPFYFSDGKVATNEEIQTRFSKKSKESYLTCGACCVKEEGILLKPYAEIAEYLSQFCQEQHSSVPVELQ